MTKVILVDMDGVIEDLVTAWTIALNEKYNKSVDPMDVEEYNLHRYFPDLTDEEFYSVLDEPEFWKTVQPMPEANEHINKLRLDGYFPVLLTGSYFTTIRPKFENCLFDKFDAFRWSDVVVTSLKNLVYGDVIIDDNIDNLIISSASLKILFSLPSNRHIDVAQYGAIRAYSWQEVYEIIKTRMPV